MTTILNPVRRGGRICVATLGIAVAILLTTLWATGGLAGAVAPDTVSYIEAFRSSTPFGEMRHPLYGMLATWLGASDSGPGHVALVQALLAAAAAVALYAGARS